MKFTKQEIQKNMDVNTNIRNMYPFLVAEKEKGTKIGVVRPLERLLEAPGLSMGTLCRRLYGVEKPKVKTQTRLRRYLNL